MNAQRKNKMNHISRCYGVSRPWVPVVGLFLALGISGAGAANLEAEFDADDFTNPTVITNQYWPMIPGTVFVYYAEGEDGCEVSRVTVLSSTKDDFAGEYGENDFEALEVEDL